LRFYSVILAAPTGHPMIYPKTALAFLPFSFRPLLPCSYHQFINNIKYDLYTIF
jgi:hypothetical protein